MKSNRGFTLVELIVVLTSLTAIAAFFWIVLDSSSKDSFTITNKVEVQSSVTSLMNVLQQDIQESFPKLDEDGINSIFFNTGEDDVYVINDLRLVRYEFDRENMRVTRITNINEYTGEAKAESVYDVYNNICDIKVEQVLDGSGANITIYGGKKPILTEADKSVVDKARYELNSTYYTRNTR